MANELAVRTAGRASDDLRGTVREFWHQRPCGEVYARGDSPRARFEEQARARYALEPYIPEFARFGTGADRDVLEVGVGMGTDHLEWAKAGPRSLTGLDLTRAAVEYTRERLELYRFAPRLLVADAEQLPFADESFDVVYSWGVLHHTPDTGQAVQEIRRVLRPGGIARVMIYHRHSIVGYMLWTRYGLMAGRPRRTLDEIYAEHVESPGTKAYSVAQARQMFASFARVRAETRLSFGDLLQGAVGRRHRGFLLSIAKAVWPRWLIRRAFRRHGLSLLIEAMK